MKIFLVKFSLLILLAGAAIAGIRAQFPYDVGNKMYHQKKEYLLDHIEEYNTVFMGSSRILRQVDPAIVDERTGTTQTYNLGTYGTFYPEIWYLTQHLLEELDSGDLQYLVIELASINYTIETNLHTVRGTYFVDDATLDFVERYVSESLALEQDREAALVDYPIARWDQWLGAGVLSHFSKPINGYDRNTLGEGRDGFAAFENPPKYLEDSLLEVEFKKMFNRRRNSIHSMLNKVIASKYPPNSAFAEVLLGLEAKAADKGITLFWVVPPLGLNLEFYSMYDTLGQDRVLSFIDREAYPRLFRASLWHDPTHLNAQGAELFSKQIGRELKERLAKE